MIIKQALGRGRDIAELERILETAPGKLRPAVEKELTQVRKGASGEREVAHFIDGLFKDNARAAVIHDLRIVHRGEVAQMDHVVFHRIQGCAWVFEGKNYSGRLACDEHGDWVQWLGGKPFDIPSPVCQAERQCRILSSWLNANGVTSFRHVKPVVVIAPSSSIKRTNLGDDVVVKSDNLARWWDRMCNQFGVGDIVGMVGRLVTKGLSHEAFVETVYRIAAAHVPDDRDWNARFGLSSAQTELPKTSPIPPSGSRSQTTSTTVPSGRPAARPVDEIIVTELGEVKVSTLPDGRIAIRSGTADALIDLVRTSCKAAGGRWNPRFKNWVLDRESYELWRQSFREA